MRHKKNLGALYECRHCGKHFLYGNRPDGLPNGLGFVLKDGRTLNMCAECIMWAGDHPEELDKWLEEIENDQN